MTITRYFARVMKDFAMSEFFEGTEVKSQVKKMGSVQN